MARTTRKQVDAAFLRLCTLLGKTPSKGHPAVAGTWILDYAACYGGYQVQEHAKRGGVRCPLGDMRRSAGDFWQMVNDMAAGIAVANELHS